VNMFDAGKTRMIGLYRMVKNYDDYVKPFSYNTNVSRTDRRTQTDGRTELLYQYRASVYKLVLCMHRGIAISTSAVNSTLYMDLSQLASSVNQSNNLSAGCRP